jgi:4-alpha-glucanotransferase
MGLFRLWWVPRGADAAHGGYVRYPHDGLLAIVAIESMRAKALVVGEDLGTVEETARRRLQQSRILSYRLLWFEEQPPERWPHRALAAVTTHDLPTIAGLWTGEDLQAQERLGLRPNADGTRRIRQRLARDTGVAPSAPIADVVVATHRLLAHAPAQLVAATLEDALGVATRPNMPGTTRAENWSVPLPLPLEDIERHPLPRRVAAALRR